MTESSIRRCNAAERAAFKAKRIGGIDHTSQGQEPALGSVDERLSILIRRLGGRTSPLPRLTDAEREQYRIQPTELMETR